METFADYFKNLFMGLAAIGLLVAFLYVWAINRAAD